MGSKVLRILYRRPERPALRIEQVPWGELAERRPKFDAWLLDTYNLHLGDLEARRQWVIIDRYQQEYLSWCSADDGSFQARLRVFREPGLDYVISLSHGILSAPVRRDELYSEPLEVRDAVEVEIRDATIMAWGWDGDVRRLDGSVVSPPPLPVLDGGRAVLPEPVGYGVARIEAVRSYDEYTVTVSPRQIDPDHSPGFSSTPGGVSPRFPAFAAQAELASKKDLYRSMVFVHWRDGLENRLESLEIEPPPLEDDVHAEDPRVPDEQPPDDEDVLVEVVMAPYIYCSGLPVEDAEIRAGGQIVRPGEALLLPPGRYPLRITGPGIIPTDEDALEGNGELVVPDPRQDIQEEG